MDLNKYLPYVYVVTATFLLTWHLWSLMKRSRTPRHSERFDHHEGDELEASLPSSPPVREDGFQYDVFLSFRGPDTRNHFTAHLYDKLNDKGIVTFIDNDKLEKGQKVDDLVECIRRSKIFVPIFSKGYADSKWCLKEIATMVECKRLIVPVFFDVEPRDVRHQTGPFKRAFRRYRKNNKTQKEEVSKWRGALTEAGNVSGYNLADTNGDQAKFVGLIVKRILREINRTPLYVVKHPVGLDSRIADVMKLLDVEAQNEAKMVGIHAMGGMGKTTVAKAVYNQISTLFDACSFISNLREATKQSMGLVTLQKQLLRDLFNDKTTNVNSTAQGIGIIKNRIGSKKVLLVLDDVDHKSHLDALAGGVNWFRSGSRIIITTRDQQILTAQNVLNLYEIKGLDDTQSLQLFSWHAFGKEEPKSKFEKLSKEVAATAAGLPLALEIFGSHCFNLDEEKQWLEMLEKLTKDQNKDIHEKLKISYDALDEEEKKVFLDIACFFIGNGRKFATFMWEDCKFFPDTTIKVLVHKSLVNTDDKTGEFEMHDHIRDMGRKIVQDESLHDAGMCNSRLWKDADETLDVLEDKREMKNVEAIQLLCGDSMSMSEESFAAMFQLRMLRLGEEVTLAGRHEHFPRKLRWLEWHPFNLDSLPDGLYLENIVVLDLSGSSITQLWNPKTSARTKAFGKLKVLDLCGCEKLTSCPDFMSMPHLQELNLVGCREIRELHPSIGHLKWLTCLDMSSCDSLKELPPEIWQLTSLQEFDLSGCSKITALPPQKQLLLDKLEVLKLNGCKELKICPDFTGMPHLERLSFEDCGNMSELHPSIGHLKQLTYLSLNHCSFLKELPPEIWQLTSLEEFDLSHCSEITVLPPQKQLVLDKLKWLDMLGCHKLRICPEFTSMPHLESLSFAGCGEMSELHPSIGDLKCLTHLSLDLCHSLKELPEQIWQLTALEVIGNHSKNTKKPSHLGDVELLKQPFLGNKLKVLSLRVCQNITKCPDFTIIPHLEMVDFSGCEKMSEFHPSIGHLKGLTYLNLSGCQSLKELPREIWQLTSLERFDLRNCPQLTDFPSQLGDSKSLEQLLLGKLEGSYLTDCENLTTCPDFMSKLKWLDLTECSSLKELPEEVGQLTLLEWLTLDSCSQISTLPESMGHLKQLKRLSLSKCSSLKEVPKSIVSLDMLDYLTVADCVQLEFLPQLPPSLTELDAKGCRQLKIIENVSNLERLCTLCLQDCERLVEVPGIEELKCLKILQLERCRSLCNSFWEILQEVNFENLDEFSIPRSPIKSEESCRQSLSFLLPKQFMSVKFSVELYLYVDQSSLDSIRSELEESNGTSKLDKSIESKEDRNQDSIPSDAEDRNLNFIPSDDEDRNLDSIPSDDEDRNLDSIPSDDEVTPPIDSLLGRVVRIDITVEDAQYSFLTSVNKRDEGSRSCYVATLDSILMKMAIEAMDDDAQRKPWMMMRVSIDGCILLDGDLSAYLKSIFYPSRHNLSFFF